MNLQELKKQQIQKSFPEIEDVQLIEAVWQYLLDHSKIGGTGQIYINFAVHDKHDFLRKIRTRYNNPAYRKVRYEKVLIKAERWKRQWGKHHMAWYKKLLRYSFFRELLK